jgi:hypothetical protein
MRGPTLSLWRLGWRACLVGAAGFALGFAAGPSIAADLDENRPYDAGSAYDDPRYRDMYEVPQPRVNGPRVNEPGYVERDDIPDDQPDVDERGYAAPDRYDDQDYRQRRYADERPDYSEGDYRDRDDRDRDYVEPKYRGGDDRGYPPRDYRDRHAAVCLDDAGIRRKLYSQGWKDFDRYRRHDRLITTEAERFGSGRDFVLAIDACTGAILEVVPKAVWRERRFDMARRDSYDSTYGRGRFNDWDPRADRYVPRY